MNQAFSDLPNWIVSVDEISAGVYRIVAAIESGSKIEITGTDPEQLINRVRTSALELERKVRRKDS